MTKMERLQIRLFSLRAQHDAIISQIRDVESKIGDESARLSHKAFEKSRASSNHASDCARWVNESCDCVIGKD